MVKATTSLTWMTDEGLRTLQEGYLLPGETPEMMYRRVANAAAARLKKPELADKFYLYMSNNWLCPATPVLSNMGTEKGLPISCYGISVPDSIDGIYTSVHELAMLSKGGGGVGVCLSPVRGRGKAVRGIGSSEGIIPWAKVIDSATIATSQGKVRKGASSVNLHVDHLDIEEFLRIRRPQGDQNRQCLNIHHCVVISNSFMEKVEKGDKKARTLWVEILKARLETGEPYLLFEDNVNSASPEAYKKNKLMVEMTNICTEITLFTDALHSFICCLSSLNLTRWEEWQGTDLVETSIYFLDGVLTEFIERAQGLPGFDRVLRSATKGRALGLGVLGWHSLLQSEGTAFDSFRATLLNRMIFKTIHERAVKASQDLAKEYGEPEWCEGTGMRNSHVLAIAPTFSNSIISGGASAGIEPFTANAFAKKTAKGVFVTKNIYLEKLLREMGKDLPEVWNSIVVNDGSVQHLDFLTPEQKEVFMTAREINQLSLVRQAGERQKYIDQAQSLNLFFPANVDPKFFHKVHFEAWKLGVKSLYYCRSSSVLKADAATREVIEKNTRVESAEECKACEG
jgi:ribonucleoside-diphosphate reductase alpha chain